VLVRTKWLAHFYLLIQSKKQFYSKQGDFMERIWAPWRMSYLSNNEPDHTCIFCQSETGVADRERLILARSDNSLIMLNRYPYTGGHLMVAPLRHTAELDELSNSELLDLMLMIRKSRSLLQRVVNPDGFNIGLNLGKAAGAGVEEHLHVHIVPRWNGDSNFMTVIGDVRVIPEGLMVAYDQLSAALVEEA
jgi:ATP adenylyltransferase